MRDYKFRGQRLDDRAWVYGSLIHYGGDHYEILSSDKLAHPGHQSFEVDPSTVGQYAGLKDKNGKNAYEGDGGEWINSLDKKVAVRIVFEDGRFFARSKLYTNIDIERISITGTIHDTPNPLEATSNE